MKPSSCLTLVWKPSVLTANKIVKRLIKLGFNNFSLRSCIFLISSGFVGVRPYSLEAQLERRRDAPTVEQYYFIDDKISLVTLLEGTFKISSEIIKLKNVNKTSKIKKLNSGEEVTYQPHTYIERSLHWYEVKIRKLNHISLELIQFQVITSSIFSSYERLLISCKLSSSPPFSLSQLSKR